jgi:CheY-like chemotaxis protein
MHMSNTVQSQGAGGYNLDAIRSRHLKILLVDDEERFRKAMRFNLSVKYGAEVTDVGGGKDAIGLLKAGAHFDLIFIDLIMPGMSGTETYAELRKVDSTCAVVLMSSYSNSEEWTAAKELSVRLVSKPILGKMLTEVLARAADV